MCANTTSLDIGFVTVGLIKRWSFINLLKQNQVCLLSIFLSMKSVSFLIPMVSMYEDNFFGNERIHSFHFQVQF